MAVLAMIVFTRDECNDILLRLDAANDMLIMAQEDSPECEPVREAKQDVSIVTDMILKALRRTGMREVSNA